jgi:hypothetical protein
LKEAEKLALLVPKSPEKFADKNSSYIKVCDDNGKSFDMNLNSFKEAKRGRDGFFGKEERQPNRHGGLKKTIRENARSSSIDTNRSNSSAFKTTSNVGLDESSRVRASLAERLQLKHGNFSKSIW